MPKSKSFMDKFVKPFLGHQNKEDRKEEVGDDFEVVASRGQRIFRYESLAFATNNFNPNQKLGEGGFGPVFKGRLRDGREVAVKQLAQGSRQGEKEFSNEVTLLTGVQHKNVVNLYGYCVHGDDKMLVYEYVPNESLDKLLFTDVEKRKELNWNRRYDIIVGVARGLLYLHEDAHTRIIHRDIKSSNILLDERLVPKIADFGMARLYPENVSSIVNTRIAGTNGYMAPEYLIHGKLSTKADIYSFGVLMLELVSGRKNTAPLLDPECSNVLEWAYKLFKKGQGLEMMDPILKSNADRDQVAMCIQIGLLCTQADYKLRPDMRKVVLILSKKPTTLEEPMRPGVTGSKHSHSRSSVTYSSGSSSSGTTYGSTAVSSRSNKASNGASSSTSSTTY